MGHIEDQVVQSVLNAKPLGVVCEKCGSDKITKISYGLPVWLNVNGPIDSRIQELLNEGLIVLGGCTIYDASPKYFCRACRNKFGIADKQHLPDGHISLNDVYKGKQHCNECKEGIFVPMNPKAKVNHGYVCNKCGNRLYID